MLNIYYALAIKDPCKNCIVKACCSKKCEVVIAIDNFIFPHDSLKSKKIDAWFTILSMILAGVSTITIIYRFL